MRAVSQRAQSTGGKQIFGLRRRAGPIATQRNCAAASGDNREHDRIGLGFLVSLRFWIKIGKRQAGECEGARLLGHDQILLNALSTDFAARGGELVRGGWIVNPEPRRRAQARQCEILDIPRALQRQLESHWLPELDPVLRNLRCQFPLADTRAGKSRRRARRKRLDLHGELVAGPVHSPASEDETGGDVGFRRVDLQGPRLDRKERQPFEQKGAVRDSIDYFRFAAELSWAFDLLAPESIQLGKRYGIHARDINSRENVKRECQLLAGVHLLPVQARSKENVRIRARRSQCRALLLIHLIGAQWLVREGETSERIRDRRSWSLTAGNGI